MSTFREIAAVLLFAGLVSLAGCRLERVDCPPVSLADPLEEVLAGYNANAVKVPRLKAYARVSMTFREKPTDLGFSWGSTSELAEPNARVFLLKGQAPGEVADFFLQIREAGQEVSRIGTSTKDGAYYAWFLAGDNQQGMWGRLSLAGAPGVKDLPVDPTQLIHGLCITTLPAGQTAAPFVAQTYSADPCAYVLTVIDRQPITNKLLFKRELYFDRQGGKPRRPMLLRIYNDRGAILVTAKLSDYQSIELADVPDPSADPPVMPTDIEVYWHDTGSELHMVLTEMTTADVVDPEAYLFWDRLPAGLKDKMRQVDKGLRPPVRIPRRSYPGRTIR